MAVKIVNKRSKMISISKEDLMTLAEVYLNLKSDEKFRKKLKELDLIIENKIGGVQCGNLKKK